MSLMIKVENMRVFQSQTLALQRLRNANRLKNVKALSLLHFMFISTSLFIHSQEKLVNRYPENESKMLRNKINI